MLVTSTCTKVDSVRQTDTDIQRRAVIYLFDRCMPYDDANQYYMGKKRDSAQ